MLHVEGVTVTRADPSLRISAFSLLSLLTEKSADARATVLYNDTVQIESCKGFGIQQDFTHQQRRSQLGYQDFQLAIGKPYAIGQIIEDCRIYCSHHARQLNLRRPCIRIAGLHSIILIKSLPRQPRSAVCTML